MQTQQYIKYLAGVMFGVLLIWIGVTGRLGSVLGAIITPDFMTNGQEFGPAAYSSSNAPQAPTSTGTYTPLQIAGLAYSAGIKTQGPLATAVAICLAESGGNTQAYNASGATGLWQVLLSAHPQYTKAQMLDPTKNAAAMYRISNAGTSWCPWQSYSGAGCSNGAAMHFNNSYSKYLSQANTAAQQTIASGGPQ